MTAQNWRERIAVHPAADLFPMLSDAELDGLAKDIDANGLTSPLSLWRARESADWQLLDGRNRLDAMARLDDGDDRIGGAFAMANRYEGERTDPLAFVVSANIRRRHLDAEQKRKIIADLLLADPTRSNRAVAALVKDNDHKVASVRAGLEATAQISQLTKTVGADGKSRPAHRQPPSAVVHNTTPRPPAVSKMDQARQLREQRFASVPASDPARSLAGEIEAFRSMLKEQRPHVERIDRTARLRLARGLVRALGIDPAELAPGGAP